MKKLLLLLTLTSVLLAKQYTFLVDDYDKELELEAKIIFNIATSSSQKPVRLFIPNMSVAEEKAFARYFTISNDCENANFVYVKKSVEIDHKCYNKKRLFFTNNYEKLLSDTKFYGAFFWNKSRPNIVFIKNRLTKDNIQLPNTYQKYVEDF